MGFVIYSAKPAFNPCSTSLGKAFAVRATMRKRARGIDGILGKRRGNNQVCPQ